MTKIMLPLALVLTINARQSFSQSFLKAIPLFQKTNGIVEITKNIYAQRESEVYAHAGIVQTNKTFLICAQRTGRYYVVGERKPYIGPALINFKLPAGSKVITAEQIEKMPYTNIEDMISATSRGVYQQGYGRSVQISGSR